MSTNIIGSITPLSIIYNYPSVGNSRWSSLKTFKTSDPTLSNYIWIMCAPASIFYNENVGAFQFISQDILSLVFGIKDPTVGYTLLLEMITNNLPVQVSGTTICCAPAYSIEAQSYAKALKQILNQAVYPPDNISNNRKPIVSTVRYEMCDSLGNNTMQVGRVAIWRELAPDNLDGTLGNYLIMGFGHAECPVFTSAY
jgi:hypothetical protein